MADGEKYTAQRVADVLLECKGFVSAAAKTLGCTNQTVRNYAKRYAIVRQAMDEARNNMDDYAEAALFKQIQDGNIAAIIFYLKTQARNRGRGYSERLEVATPEGEAIRIVMDK